jgi:hypothetical protein
MAIIEPSPIVEPNKKPLGVDIARGFLIYCFDVSLLLIISNLPFIYSGPDR